MLRRIITYLLLLTASVAGAVAPNFKPDDKVWVESPTARAFSEAMMPTPALLTGACEFSLPLYTINVEGFKIPFTLKYHSNGIKVFDNPGIVGFGWNLTPALQITRQIMGRPDGYYENVAAKGAEYVSSDVKKALHCVASRYSLVSESQFLDTEYDIYTIYLIDATLTVIYKDGRFIGVNNDEYRIATRDNLKTIQVTDPQGNIYDFSTGGKVQHYITFEWLLTAITLQSGTRLTFSWRETNKFLINKPGFSRDSIADPRTLIYNDPTEPSFKYDTYRYLSEYRIPLSPTTDVLGEKLLSEVIFPGGKLACSYNNDFLTTITVSNKTATVFTATLIDKNNELLQSVNISGVGLYKFFYNKPPRVKHESACDWWGYPNGKNNYNRPGYYLSPEVKIKGVNTELSDIHVDRSVNEEESKAYLLSQVVYPTGGCTTWYYEPHRFEAIDTVSYSNFQLENQEPLTVGGGMRVKMITHSPGLLSNTQKKRYYYGENRNGKAQVETAPFLRTFIDYCRLAIYRNNDESPQDKNYSVHNDLRLIINHQSDYLDQHPGIIPIWYDKVEEVTNEGKTEYSFNMLAPKNRIYDKYRENRLGFGESIPGTSRCQYHLYSPFSTGPQLTNRKIYKLNSGGDYSIVEEEEFDYNLTSSLTDSVVPFFRVRRNHVVLDGVNAPDWDLQPGSQLKHKFRAGIHTVSNNEEIMPMANYDDFHYNQDPFNTDPMFQAQFWYDPQNYELHLQTEQLRSKIHRKYYGNQVMSQKETYSYLPGTSLLQSTVVTDGNDSIRTDYEYTDRYSATMNGVMKSRNITGVPTVVMETQTISGRTAVHGYSLEMWQTNGIPVRPRRVWQHRGDHRWSTNLYEYDKHGLLSKKTTPYGLVTEWERDETGNPVKMTVGNQLVSTAKWSPLVGVTELVTPAGTKQTFGYDDQSRLSSVWLNSRLMEEYEYSTEEYDHYVLNKRHYSVDGYMNNYTRYDQLGRIYAEMAEQPDGTYLTAYTDYDNMGRPCGKWLPIPTNSSIATKRHEANVKAYYSDDYPYEAISYEPSQRNLLAKTTRAGQQWHENNRFTSVNFSTNITVPSFKSGIDKYIITEDGIKVIGKYPTATLVMQTEWDENRNLKNMFTDFRGLTIERSNPGTTRYVYNDYGELAYILPPGLEGTHSRSDDEMQQLAYWYDYDDRGRMITKKLPGVRETYYIYDAADRIAAEQNADLPDGVWRIYGYDHLGRSVLTLDCSISRQQAREYAAGMNTATLDGGALAGYTLTGVPSAVPEIVSASYYDNYEFITQCNLPEEFKIKYQPSYQLQIPFDMLNAKGLLTGVYTGKGYEAYYYNQDGNMIQRYATGFNSGRTTNSYTYSGQVATTVHEPIDTEDEEVGRTIVRYTYDNCGRPIKTEITKSFPIRVPMLLADKEGWEITLPPVRPELARDSVTTVLTTTYNSLGQAVTTTHGSGATRNYTYEMHGWLKNTLTELPGKALSETLHYETGKYPCYNGNISAKEWTSGRYDYRYDAANRLTDAEFDTSNYPADYSTSYTYDKRGNPLSIMRQGQIDPPSGGNVYCGELDNITLRYTGNRLTSLFAMSNLLEFDGATGLGKNGNFKLEYDAAGRLTKDQSRNIRSVEYDNNGNPVLTTFYDGNQVEEVYDGLGNHLATIHNGDTINQRRYTGAGHIYASGELQMERVPGGYFNFADRRFYHYLTDYQGNNIAVVSDSGAIVQQTDYYPYGEPWSEPTHPFTYSDNERLHAYGQNQYDFHARRLIPTLLRFDRPDPLNEQYPWLSPYTYCGGNPILLSDPNGLNPVYTVDGVYLGDTAEGFSGLILIYDGNEEIDFSKYTADKALEKFADSLFSMDKMRVDLSTQAIECIWNNILDHFNGQNIFDKEFNRESIGNSKVTYEESPGNSWITHKKDNRITGTNDYRYESTVENLASSMIVHEWYSHLIMGTSNRKNNHRLAYESVINSQFWEKTTEKYKRENLSNLMYYTKKETKNSILKPEYKKLYDKYVKN